MEVAVGSFMMLGLVRVKLGYLASLKGWNIAKNFSNISMSAHQQRLATASQLMTSSNFPLSPMAANKCMNFLQQQHLQSAESPGLNLFPS
ncbi:hypothetical protein KY285_000944 [Solanum tuberosum]|nr:hypothetical protein KY285_000944 [Solanum tuberosum]